MGSNLPDQLVEISQGGDRSSVACDRLGRLGCGQLVEKAGLSAAILGQLRWLDLWEPIDQ